MPSTTPSDSSSVKNAAIVVLIGLLAWTYNNCADDRTPAQGSFSQEIVDSVLPIRERVHSSPEKAEALGKFYVAWADALERDQGNRIRTTALFRTAHSFSLDVYLQETGMQGAPTVGEEIDAAIISAIGNKVIPIDEDISQQLQEVLLAIAWACDAKIPE